MGRMNTEIKKTYHMFSLPVRIISAILIISFLAYDISWAYPDRLLNAPSQNNKLAPQSIFESPEKESIDRFYLAFIYQKIEDVRRRIPNLQIESVKKVHYGVVG